MKRADLVQPLAYVGVSILSVGLAFMISLKFIGRTHAQNQAPPPQQQAPAQAAPSGEDGADDQGEPHRPDDLADAVQRFELFARVQRLVLEPQLSELSKGGEIGAATMLSHFRDGLSKSARTLERNEPEGSA